MFAKRVLVIHRPITELTFGPEEIELISTTYENALRELILSTAATLFAGFSVLFGEEPGALGQLYRYSRLLMNAALLHCGEILRGMSESGQTRSLGGVCGMSALHLIATVRADAAAVPIRGQQRNWKVVDPTVPNSGHSF